MPTDTMETGSSGYVYSYDINGVGQHKVSFKTENKFVDKNINITINTVGASAPTLSITDKTGALDMGSASNGVYSPTLSLSGNVNIATAGWITSGNKSVTDNSVAIGTVPQATLSGVTAVTGKTEQYEITPGASAKTITIAQGYYPSNRTISVKAQSAGGSASSPTLSLTDLTSALNMGTATNGTYSPTVSLSGIASIATGGYIASGDYNVSDTNVKVGTVAQSAITGVNTGSSGVMSVTPNTTATKTVTISAGYYPDDREVKVYGQQSGQKAIVTSGTATISSVTCTYSSANANYILSGSANVSAPTVSQSGYIDNSNGTKNANSNGATLSATLDKIGLGVAITGTTSTLKPTLSSVAVPNAVGYQHYGFKDARAQGATLVTTLPELPQYESRAYIAVRSDEITGTLTATPNVSSAGYGDATNYGATGRTATVGAAQSDVYYIRVKEANITSGSVTISSITPTYDSTNGNFSLATTATIPAPAYTEGFIAYGTGVKTEGTAEVTATLPKIGIKGEFSQTSGLYPKPVISKNTNTNVVSGTATTTKPSSGYYVAVASADSHVSITAKASVTSNGYGTTTSGQYTVTSANAVSVGAQASAVTYIPITAATFANKATSGTTYTDISNSAPALISGDYLYINAGYTPAQKISLAKLVPDASQTNAAAAYIRSGYSAYDNNGALIVGTMATYDGTYEVV